MIVNLFLNESNPILNRINTNALNSLKLTPHPSPLPSKRLCRNMKKPNLTKGGRGGRVGASREAGRQTIRETLPKDLKR
jgi:hypothetical protein